MQIPTKQPQSNGGPTGIVSKVTLDAFEMQLDTKQPLDVFCTKITTFVVVCVNTTPQVGAGGTEKQLENQACLPLVPSSNTTNCANERFNSSCLRDRRHSEHFILVTAASARVFSDGFCTFVRTI